MMRMTYKNLRRLAVQGKVIWADLGDNRILRVITFDQDKFYLEDRSPFYYVEDHGVRLVTR